MDGRARSARRPQPAADVSRYITADKNMGFCEHLTTVDVVAFAPGFVQIATATDSGIGIENCTGRKIVKGTRIGIRCRTEIEIETRIEIENECSDGIKIKSVTGTFRVLYLLRRRERRRGRLQVSIYSSAWTPKPSRNYVRRTVARPLCGAEFRIVSSDNRVRSASQFVGVIRSHAEWTQREDIVYSNEAPPARLVAARRPGTRPARSPRVSCANSIAAGGRCARDGRAMIRDPPAMHKPDATKPTRMPGGARNYVRIVSVALPAGAVGYNPTIRRDHSNHAAWSLVTG
ncbi:hypothetical protein EVAR_60971_1 [Eumeta japonica]|uniref:Uncharacterized protein n=1 Tax=Eumeta variegata TaxID=151549 RepID=A0A4C1XW90_EUMVA|nr:hypothetical protein EVAR_60971_1 [Eumeta japonica]